MRTLRALLPALTAVLPPLAAGAADSSGTIETPFFRITLSPGGECEVFDKPGAITWSAQTKGSPLGFATLLTDSKPQRVVLSGCDITPGKKAFTAVFHPSSKERSAALRVHFQALPDRRTLQVSYDGDPQLKIQSVSLLDDVLGVTASGHGSLLVPVREGLLIPADSGLNFTHRFDTYTYEGCHMQMFGALQNGAAALVSWDDCYTALDLKSVCRTNSGAIDQRISPALVLTRSAKAFRVQFLGKGDHVTVAKAYRGIAKEKGFLVQWNQKLKEDPERAKLFGAINYKLWSTLDRRMNEDSTKEESVRVNWTFEEAAQVAEHLKRDLQLDKVLFTMGGWIHRGYDNQHPDVLPTAPECGGDAAFAECARRVMDLGYLLCLHDNYQDIYRDSPSWDERFIMKTPDGKLAKGGHWAGGIAYLTCSKMALELAKRPQDLPAVKKLSNANSYFIDTTYAAGLQECFDPNHPLTRADDMHWKQALSDYAREIFGVFGSECGREWAIPHSDFFEGLTGVSGGFYHDANLVPKLGATVVPLFEIVYRDCIAMYGKYGYDPQRAAPYVLHHISIGRPLNYHSIPPHLYWKRADETARLGLRPGVAEMKQTGPRAVQATYRWQVESTPADDWNVFVHFTDPAGNIKFQNDYQPDLPVSRWTQGEVRQGPFTFSVPEGLTGAFNVRMGLFQAATGERALLQGRDNSERSYFVGRLKISEEKVEFQPMEIPVSGPGDPALFVRSENGWAKGLHPMDRFVKNTYEILSPLNEITSNTQMTAHRFLTSDRKVQQTIFGEGQNAVTVTVNSGSANYNCASRNCGEVVLPPFGFLVESSPFIAFHALSWNGLSYSAPVMFTLRSLDDRPIQRSRKIRVYHAFGAGELKVGKASQSVGTEAVVQSR